MSSETESLESVFVAEILGTLQRRVLSYRDAQGPRCKYIVTSMLTCSKAVFSVSLCSTVPDVHEGNLGNLKLGRGSYRCKELQI